MVDWRWNTAIDPAKNTAAFHKHRQKFSTKTYKNDPVYIAKRPQNKCLQLAPHAPGGLQFYSQLLHPYASRCRPNFDSKAPGRLQVYRGLVQSNPHPPNENAPPQRISLYKTTNLNYLYGYICQVLWDFFSAMIHPQ